MHSSYVDEVIEELRAMARSAICSGCTTKEAVIAHCQATKEEELFQDHMWAHFLPFVADVELIKKELRDISAVIARHERLAVLEYSPCESTSEDDSGDELEEEEET
jgi:alpha-D-ribose 1-methylphosphonate 5-triphosphate synthase subunit PhnI